MTYGWVSLVTQRLKRLPAMKETWVWSLGQEDPLEKEMATHSSILAWKIPWTEEPGGLQSTGSQWVGHNWVTSLSFFLHRELPDVQAGVRKGRGTRDQIANICWIIEKARVPEKHLFLLYWLCQSLWLCGSQTVENSERDGNTRPPPYLPPEKSVKEQQLWLYME